MTHVFDSGDYSPANTLRVRGGGYYGSLYVPQHRGSRGGNGQYDEGGNGGGVINLIVCACLPACSNSYSLSPFTCTYICLYNISLPVIKIILFLQLSLLQSDKELKTFVDQSFIIFSSQLLNNIVLNRINWFLLNLVVDIRYNSKTSHTIQSPCLILMSTQAWAHIHKTS